MNICLAVIFILLGVAFPRLLFPLGAQLFYLGALINTWLAIFNLIPIPPLDGSKILMGLLPPAQALSYARLEPYGFIILLVLIMTNAFDILLFPLIRGAIQLFLGS